MSSKERLMQVLVAPHVSEKAARAAEQGNQMVFRVARDATKPEIKAAVELMFEVKVDAVQVVSDGPLTGGLRGTTAYQISRNLAAGTGAVLSAAGTGTDNDYVAKVTMDGSSTITLPGTEYQKAQMGLLGMVDDGTYLSTYFGLSRLDFPHALNATVTASAGVLSADLLQRAIDTVDVVAGGKTSAIWSEHAARRAYLTITEADRRFVGGDLKSPDPGTAAAKNPTGKQGIFFGGIPWYTDAFCPYGNDLRAGYRLGVSLHHGAGRVGGSRRPLAVARDQGEHLGSEVQHLR